MESFKIKIEETLCKVIEIEAENIESALTEVKEMYKNEEIVLDYNDFLDYKIQQL